MTRWAKKMQRFIYYLYPRLHICFNTGKIMIYYWRQCHINSNHDCFSCLELLLLGAESSTSGENICNFVIIFSYWPMCNSNNVFLISYRTLMRTLKLHALLPIWNLNKPSFSWIFPLFIWQITCVTATTCCLIRYRTVLCLYCMMRTLKLRTLLPV
jgi:hypothetical protein